MQLQLYGEKIWVLKQPVDFRRSIDGLSSLIINKFGINPNNGLFIFHNKNKDKIKCLTWHKNGFLLLYKRLELGKFKFLTKQDDQTQDISMKEFGWLLAGLEWQHMSQWQELDYDKFD